MARFPDKAALRQCGLVPVWGTLGIWQNQVNDKPGPVFLVLLGPDSVAVGGQYTPSVWKGQLQTIDELKRCLTYAEEQLNPTES